MKLLLTILILLSGTKSFACKMQPLAGSKKFIEAVLANISPDKINGIDGQFTIDQITEKSGNTVVKVSSGPNCMKLKFSRYNKGNCDTKVRLIQKKKCN